MPPAAAQDSFLLEVRKYVTTFVEGILFAITWHSALMLTLTVLATLCCAKGLLDISMDMCMNIVTVGTIFPLVFCVQASYQRRERALAALSSLKGTIFVTFLMFKTWDKQGSGKAAAEVQELFSKLVEDIVTYLRHKPTNESAHVVYDGFATLADKIKDFVPVAGYSKAGEGGMSRMQQYLRDIMVHFENVRAVRDTETPIGLRLFCFALIHFSPILLAPYWNNFCSKQNQSEIPANYGCESGYFVASFYVLINLTLYRVQTELEDPFDGDGRDDIKWGLWCAQLHHMDDYGPDGPPKRQERSAGLPYQQSDALKSQ